MFYTLYVSRELCKLKKKKRYQYMSIGMAKTKILTSPSAGENTEQQEHIFPAGDVEWYVSWKTVWCFFYKAKHTLTMQSSS